MNDRYFNINAEKCNIRCKIYYDDLKGLERMVVFFHGFGGHKDNKAAERFARRMLMKNKKIAMVTFDWPCHGEDVRKVLTLNDCDTYLRLVLEYVREHYGVSDIYAYATSFGGYLILKYIKEHGNPFVKITMRSPAINMYESMTQTIMTDENRAQLSKGKMTKVGFDRKVEIGQAFLDEIIANDVREWDFIDFADDMMIIHGTEDEIVPFGVSKEFAEENVIDLIPVEGADHRYINQKKMEFAINEIIRSFGLK